jgi:type I restriction-modification system DNA methylase subunit
MPKYTCQLCNQVSEQKSHHNTHLKCSKHQQAVKIFTLELEKLSDDKRIEKYGKTDISEIVKDCSTVIEKPNELTIEKKTFAGDFNITNSDSLKEHIHSIHNYLRNHGGGYGLGALKIFNIFYGIKKLEEHGLNEMIGLSEAYWFSSLLKMSKEMTDEEFHYHIVDGLLNELYEKPSLKEFIFYEIPKNIKSDVFRYLIGEINDITRIEKESNVLLSGKVYEYFVGRDESAISELGAYFTNRNLVDYTIGKVNPQLDSHGNVPSMIDMFGGSGGFTTGYVNYMKELYPNIDWNTNVHNIFHYDINEDVLKAAALEIFCLTGELPKMENIAYKHSFKTEFTERPKYILTNPPYGGDKNKKSQAQEKRDILKKHILSSPELKEKHSEQLKFILSEERKEKKVKEKNKVSLETCSQLINKYAKLNGLTGNDKESCSLILLMAMLTEGGTCAGVLKEGVMFDKKYKALRKCLVENFNVREVVSIPADQFENTTTKTSLVIFDNTEEKTSVIKFSKLDVVKYTENKIEEQNGCLVLTEMKGDISGVQEVAVSTATIQDVQQNSIYSLNGKDYNQNEIVCGEDYKLVELGSICNTLTTTKHCTNIGKSSGPYRFYNSSQSSELYVDFCEVKNTSIILGQGGNFNIHIDSNFTPSKHVCVIQEKNQNISLLTYLYYVIPMIQDTLTKNGSTIGWLNKTNIRLFKIPVPKNPEKIQHWVDKISQPYNEKNEKQTRIQELEKTIQERIQSICDNEDCEEVNFDDVLCYMKKKNKYKATDGKINGKYRFYTSSQEKVLFRDDYEFENTHILIGRGGVASLHLTSKFSVTHDDVYVLTTKNSEVDIKYIFNYIKINIGLIEQSFKGSTIKHSSKTALSKIKIKLPKNKKLIDDLNPMFQEIEEHQQGVKDADELYKKYIQELSNEAIPKL